MWPIFKIELIKIETIRTWSWSWALRCAPEKAHAPCRLACTDLWWSKCTRCSSTFWLSRPNRPHIRSWNIEQLSYCTLRSRKGHFWTDCSSWWGKRRIWSSTCNWISKWHLRKNKSLPWGIFSCFSWSLELHEFSIGDPKCKQKECRRTQPGLELNKPSLFAKYVMLNMLKD